MRLSSKTRGLAAIYGSSLMLSFGHGMYIPAIPALAASFEVSIGAAAQVVTAHALGRLVGTPVGGIVVDRVGAGDAVFSVAALCVAQNAPMEIVGFIGNAVGAEAVAIVGNRTSIQRASLLKHIETLLK